MAFKRIGGKRNYIKYGECKPNQVLLPKGEYIGTEEGTYGIQYVFKLENGEFTVLNSAQHLNYLFDRHINVGDIVRVTYVGKSIQSKGPLKGKEYHEFCVEVDDGTEGVDDAPTSVAMPEPAKAAPVVAPAEEKPVVKKAARKGVKAIIADDDFSL